jgi:hypothetical protein
MIDVSKTNIEHVFLRHVSLNMLLCCEVPWGGKHTHVSAFPGIIFVRKVEEFPARVSPRLTVVRFTNLVDRVRTRIGPDVQVRVHPSGWTEPNLGVWVQQVGRTRT